MAKKVDPTLKTAPIPEATASSEGGDASGAPATSSSGSESSNVIEQQSSPENGNGDVSGEKHTFSGSSQDGVNPHLLRLAVELAWGDAVNRLRETGMLTRLPEFATAAWFYGLIDNHLKGVLR